MLMTPFATALALTVNARALNAPSYPVPASPPRWSWDTLGSMAFAHVCQPMEFSATQLEQLQRYNFVQFDKQMNTESMPLSSQEDRFIAAARQVKSVNADAKVLLYLNGLINFPAFQRLYNATLKDPSLLLVNASGAHLHLLSEQDGGVFDVRKPAMRNLFVADTQYAMASRAVDGVFIDRANWAEKCIAGSNGFDATTCASLPAAQRLMLEEITTALGPGAIVLAKDTSDAPIANNAPGVAADPRMVINSLTGFGIGNENAAHNNPATMDRIIGFFSNPMINTRIIPKLIRPSRVPTMTMTTMDPKTSRSMAKTIIT